MILITNNNTNNIRQDYINLIQYAIKKGNKNKVENILRSLLFFIIKNPSIQNTFNFADIKKAILNTSPKISVKTKRKGSRNIYVPIKITPSRSKFLSSKWIISHAKLKTNNKFYKNLAEEIIDSSKKTSLSTKKRNDLHKLAEANFLERNKNVYKKPVINKEVLINFEKAVIEKKLIDKKKEELDNIKSSSLKFKNHLNFLKK